MAKTQIVFGEVGGGGKYSYGTFTFSNSNPTVDCGFAPKRIFMYGYTTSAGTNPQFYAYADLDESLDMCIANNNSALGWSTIGTMCTISGNNIAFGSPSSSFNGMTVHWWAFPDGSNTQS